jgi:hypothetical protein
MITKRPSQNTGAVVLFIAAILVILTVAIAPRFMPANLPSSNFSQRQPKIAIPVNSVQAATNFDAHDYYMTHPQSPATTNFDAHDYYMTHPTVNKP